MSPVLVGLLAVCLVGAVWALFGAITAKIVQRVGNTYPPCDLGDGMAWFFWGGLTIAFVSLTIWAVLSVVGHIVLDALGRSS